MLFAALVRFIADDAVAQLPTENRLLPDIDLPPEASFLRSPQETSRPQLG